MRAEAPGPISALSGNDPSLSASRLPLCRQVPILAEASLVSSRHCRSSDGRGVLTPPRPQFSGASPRLASCVVSPGPGRSPRTFVCGIGLQAGHHDRRPAGRPHFRGPAVFEDDVWPASLRSSWCARRGQTFPATALALSVTRLYFGYLGDRLRCRSVSDADVLVWRSLPARPP
jgi:hypothetical protein